ncbi:MAG: pilus assembly protein TadG-related protein [Planctomycetota bacterium]|nr:pilus assembly protein TadG-related protein [Planctomycetota bacterium]
MKQFETKRRSYRGAKNTRRSARNRRGALLVLSAFMMIVVLAMVAFAVDLGIIINARTEAQRAADSAALAAAWELATDAQLLGNSTTVQDNMRSKASEYANYHTIGNLTPYPQLNMANDAEGDIVIGRLSNPSNLSETMTYNSILGDNAVTVRLRMLSARDRSIPLSFARILGFNSTDVSAEATAIFDDSVVGFRTNSENPTSGLLPFVLHVDVWQDLMDGLTTDDNLSYDPVRGDVTAGSDGIAEISMFPGGGSSGSGNGSSGNGGNQAAPGNFGTVDIGDPNNSTFDLERQIESGPNLQDFSHHGGELTLDAGSQTTTLNGETGLSASMASALDQIVGDSRSIMLYNQVTGSGNTAMFTVVGFAGIRIMDFQLNGGNKYILIQPTMVSDPTAVSGNYGQSYFVGQPVRLVR